MIIIRKGTSRGKTQTDWLNSRHTFSFGDYYDPDFMGFNSLRVINEDIVQPAKGFGFHSHKNMEIISYVIEGALEHKDSMGTGSVIRPGEVQCMSAGTGVEHSEFNHSSTDLVHFLQIWIIPEKNVIPSYQQQCIPQLNNELILIGSGKDQNGIIKINQNIQLYAAYLFATQTIHHTFADNRCGWVQLVKGRIVLNNQELCSGDGAAILDKNIDITSIDDAEFLLFDLLNI